MKCPKCDYLGFDTGDRCKNCGYDFSLMTAEPAVPDLELRLADDQPEAAPAAWLDQIDGALGDAQPARNQVSSQGLGQSRHDADDQPAVRSVRRQGGYSPPARPAAAVGRPAPAATLTPPAIEPAPAARPMPAVPDLSLEPPMPPPSFRGEPALPLFSPASADDDQPLIRVPAAPRAPLSVRRTPDTPRLRPSRTVERPAPEPTLQFAAADAADELELAPPPARRREARPRTSLQQAAACSSGARVLAAVLDHAMLGAVDGLVLYFTLRIAGLTMGDWRAVPPLPMIGFLLLLKVAYFAAFTAVGGQTIGKMATGIRVVSDADDFVDPSRAISRALAGIVSVLTLGIAFVPALIGADRRAIHDRLAHTRVVALPSA